MDAVPKAERIEQAVHGYLYHGLLHGYFDVLPFTIKPDGATLHIVALTAEAHVSVAVQAAVWQLGKEFTIPITREKENECFGARIACADISEATLERLERTVSGFQKEMPEYIVIPGQRKIEPPARPREI